MFVICVRQVDYAASSGNSLSTFPENPSVPSSKIKNPTLLRSRNSFGARHCLVNSPTCNRVNRVSLVALRIDTFRGMAVFQWSPAHSDRGLRIG